jgi:hypothetical protein
VAALSTLEGDMLQRYGINQSTGMTCVVTREAHIVHL